MPNRPTRVKESVESDVKFIKRAVVVQIVVVLSIVVAAIIGGYYLFTYLYAIFGKYFNLSTPIPGI